jgi:choline dehydrogenase-like flavoprotein
MTGLTPLFSPVAKSAALHPKCKSADVNQSAQYSADVIVVGTGAGGAIAGTQLAKKGNRVLFLEAGGAFTAKDFQKKSLIWATRNLYAGSGLQISLGTPPILIPQGQCVGGSTVLNSGICFRPPDAKLQEWAAMVGDERLLPESIGPHVSSIWKRLAIAPTHAGIGRRNNDVLRLGLDRIGMIHDWIDRNAPGCIGCGVCHLGCPSGGKASVDKSILPEAMHHGAEILTRVRVEGVIIENGSVTGVEGNILDPETRNPIKKITVKAPRVIIAASAFGSPLILEKSGIESPALGEHLSLHPGGAVLAEFADPIMMWDGVPQGYWGRDPDNEHVIIESANAGAAEIYTLLGKAGGEGAALAKRFPYFALAGAMLRDEGEGTIRLVSGFKPLIRYDLSDADIDRLKRGMKTVVRAYFAAGAKAVCPLVHPSTFYDREEDALAAIDAVQTGVDFSHAHASHPHGTCRMGTRDGEHSGVVDGNGQVYGVQGLYVMDGSIFPSTLGVNPQVTIMSMASALSERL